MYYLFVILALFIVTVAPGKAQVDRSCLTPYYIDEPGVPPDFYRGASVYQYYNDTLMMNICGSGLDIRGLYARERFFVEFIAHSDLVPTSIRQSDTIVDFSWQQLSTDYPEDRTSMQAMEQRFGSYHLRFYPEPPENMLQDHYQIIFEEYTNLDSVQQLFYLSQEIILRTDFFVVTAVSDEQAPAKYATLSLSPNPASDYLHIQLPSGHGATIELYNATGNRLLQYSGTINSEATRILDIRSLPMGTYQCVLHSPDSRISTAPFLIVR